MGQRANGLSEGEEVASETAEASERKPVEIEREIAALREELDQLVDELDRRRHHAFDWRLQLRKHARPIAIGAGVIVGVVVFRGVLRRRRTPAAWSERLGQIVHGVIPAERAPSLVGQLGKTAALGLASAAARHVAEQAIAGARARSSSYSGAE